MPVENRLQIQNAGSCGNISPFCQHGHFPQQITIQTTLDNMAIPVPQRGTHASLLIRQSNFTPCLIAKTNGQDTNTPLGRILGGFQGERVLVFAIGNQQDGT